MKLPFDALLAAVRAHPAWRALLARGFQPAAGVRMTAAAVTPMIAGQLIGQPAAGVLVGVGGLFVSFLDSGTAYRQKLRTLLTATGAIACAGALGVLAGAHPALAVPALALVACAAGLASIFGAAAESTSIFVLIAFIVNQNAPGGLHDSYLRGLGLLTGGLWATAMSLVLWPIRPYGPALDAVRDCYHALAALYRARLRTAETGTERRALENALARAREVALAARLTGSGISRTGQAILVLIRTADLLYAAGIALTAAADAARANRHDALIGRPLRASVLAAAETAQLLGDSIGAAGGAVDRARFDRHLARFEAKLAACPAGLVEPRQLAAALQRVADLIDTARDTAAALGDSERPIAGELEPLADPAETPGFWARLGDHWSWDSLVLRHAVRLGIACALGLWIAEAWHLYRGVWVPLTVAIILKPDFGGTRERVLGRVTGTVLGGLIAAALTFLLRDPWINLAALIPLGILAYSQKTVAYQRFVMFLTMFVLVMLNLVEQGDWRDPVFRAFDTALGGGIGLLAAYVFWRRSPLLDLPERTAAALDTAREYFVRVAGRLRGEERGTLREARQAAQLAAANLAVDFQRALSQDEDHPEAEPFYSLANAAQRLVDAIVTLAAARPRALSPPLEQEIAQWFAALAAHARARSLPPPAPELPGSPGRSTRRVFEELQGIRNALERLERAHRPGSNLLA